MDRSYRKKLSDARGRPIAYLSEKLNESKLKYSTHEKDLYAVIHALQHWEDYLVGRNLFFIKAQKKLSSCHAGWVAYMEKFSFVLNQKFGISNKLADALSWKHSLFSTLSYDILGFDLLPENYTTDFSFQGFFARVAGDRTDYVLINDYPFKGNQLCLPEGSIRKFFINKLHGGRLGGHFGRIRLKPYLRNNSFGLPRSTMFLICAEMP